MLNSDWLGVPRLHTLRTIGARSIKTWRGLVCQVTSNLLML